MVDMVVPPRTPYLLPTLPHNSCGKPARLKAHEVWYVQAQSEEEEEVVAAELKDAEEQLHRWRQQQQARSPQANKPRVVGAKTRQSARTSRQGWDSIPLGEEEEHLQEYVAVLSRQLSSGTAETATRPKWHDRLNTAVVPVNGINTSEEPLIIRVGERVALGTKLASTTVALLEEVPAQESGWDPNPSLCNEGIVVKGMKIADRIYLTFSIGYRRKSERG